MTLVSLTSPRGWPQPSLHVALRSEMSQTPSSSETQFLQGADVQPHAGGRESVRLVNSERRGPLWFCRPVGVHGRLCPSMSPTDGHQALTSNHGNTAVTMRPTPIKTDGDFRIHSCSRPEGRDCARPIELPQTALCPSDRRGKLRVSRAVRAARVARGPLTKPKPPSGVCAPAPSHAVCGGRWGVLLTGLSPTARTWTHPLVLLGEECRKLQLKMLPRAATGPQASFSPCLGEGGGGQANPAVLARKRASFLPSLRPPAGLC